MTLTPPPVSSNQHGPLHASTWTTAEIDKLYHSTLVHKTSTSAAMVRYSGSFCLRQYKYMMAKATVESTLLSDGYSGVYYVYSGFK